MNMLLKIETEYYIYDSLEELSETQRSLLLRAKQNTHHAYAPYSKFYVGAAILTDDGNVIDGLFFVSVYSNEPTDAPANDVTTFGKDTKDQLEEDGWSSVQIKSVEKYNWQGGVWFITAYEGIYEGKKEYCEEYYWEDSQGNTRLLDVSFYDKAEMERARPEFLKIIYSAQMWTGGN